MVNPNWQITAAGPLTDADSHGIVAIGGRSFANRAQNQLQLLLGQCHGVGAATGRRGLGAGWGASGPRQPAGRPRARRMPPEGETGVLLSCYCGELGKLSLLLGNC